MAAHEARAQSASTHKALVCINLNGGNDQSNTVVPAGTAEYNAYLAARPALALLRSQMLSLAPQGYSGQPLALHSALGGLKTLFDQGRVALLANVARWPRPSPRLNGTPGKVQSKSTRSTVCMVRRQAPPPCDA